MKYFLFLSALLFLVGCSQNKKLSGIYLNQSITADQDYMEIVASPAASIIIDSKTIRLSGFGHYEILKYERLLEGKNGRMIVDGLQRCISCDGGNWPKGTEVEFFFLNHQFFPTRR